jgi:hypothetical protein
VREGCWRCGRAAVWSLADRRDALTGIGQRSRGRPRCAEAGGRDHAARTGSATRSESSRRCCRRAASVTIVRGGGGWPGHLRSTAAARCCRRSATAVTLAAVRAGVPPPRPRRSAIPRSAPRPGATPGCAQPRPPVAMVGGARMTRRGYAASSPPPGAGPSPTAPPRTGAHHAPFRSRCRRASARHSRHPDALVPGDRRMTSYEVDAALAPDLASPQGPRSGPNARRDHPGECEVHGALGRGAQCPDGRHRCYGSRSTGAQATRPWTGAESTAAGEMAGTGGVRVG